MLTQGNLYALLIGINDYESEAVRRLQFAVADVAAFRQFLIQRMGLNPDNSVLLSHPAVESAVNPRRSEVLRALDRFSVARMQPEDTFVVYFAGHGFASDDVSFLLTVDSDPNSSNLLQETAISLVTLKRFVQCIRAGQQLVILDACRNEPTTLTRSMGTGCLDTAMARNIVALARDPQADLARPVLRARAVLSACWEGQVSYECPARRRGWFSHNLLQTLQEHPDGDIEITSLTELVRQRMLARAWRELPEARYQEPHLELQGRSLHLRMSVPESALELRMVTDPKPLLPAAGASHVDAWWEADPSRLANEIQCLRPLFRDLHSCEPIFYPGIMMMIGKLRHPHALAEDVAVLFPHAFPAVSPVYELHLAQRRSFWYASSGWCERYTAGSVLAQLLQTIQGRDDVWLRMVQDSPMTETYST